MTIVIEGGSDDVIYEGPMHIAVSWKHKLKVCFDVFAVCAVTNESLFLTKAYYCSLVSKHGEVRKNKWLSKRGMMYDKLAND